MTILKKFNRSTVYILLYPVIELLLIYLNFCEILWIVGLLSSKINSQCQFVTDSGQISGDLITLSSNHYVWSSSSKRHLNTQFVGLADLVHSIECLIHFLEISFVLNPMVIKACKPFCLKFNTFKFYLLSSCMKSTAVQLISREWIENVLLIHVSVTCFFSLAPSPRNVEM